ncbi:MAG: hypothetical protein NZ839_02685 [Endomicrobia bacterium]|nr:hypothetical protein [Endomicrobiia bacterium]
MTKKIFLYTLSTFFISSYLTGDILNLTGLYEKKIKLGLTYNHGRYRACFQRITPTEILLDLNGKQFKYFDDTNVEYTTEILANSGIVSIVFNPFGKIMYNLAIKQITSLTAKIYSRELSSISDSFGFIIGLGYSVFPQTIISPGITTGMRFSIDKYKFDILTIDSLKYKISTDIAVIDTSVYITLTKIVVPFFFELNCTGEVVCRNSAMIDKVNLYKISGNETFVKVAVNNRFYLTKKESAFAEIVYFIGRYEYIFSVGFIIGW